MVAAVIPAGRRRGYLGTGAMAARIVVAAAALRIGDLGRWI
jgi:hypothetical protein